MHVRDFQEILNVEIVPLNAETGRFGCNGGKRAFQLVQSGSLSEGCCRKWHNRGECQFQESCRSPRDRLTVAPVFSEHSDINSAWLTSPSKSSGQQTTR